MFYSFVFWFVFNAFTTDVNPYQIGDQLFVTAKSGINLRVAPSRSGKILKGIGFNSPILIEDHFNYTTEYEDEIDGRRGHWIKIRAGNQVGYVFDGFLCKLPAPQPFSTGPVTEILRSYALEQIGPIQPTISYIQLGKDADYTMHITNLNYRCQFVEKEYCDSRELELIIRNIKLADIAYLFDKLFSAYISGNPDLVTELLKSDEIVLPLLMDSSYSFSITKVDYNYSIALIPSVDCC